MPRLAEDAAFKLSKVWTSHLEREYGITLRKIAKKIGDYVKQYFDGTPLSAIELADIFEEYSETLTPWATIAAAGMLERSNTRNYITFKKRSKQIGELLRREVYHAPTGIVMQTSLARQVGLITSLPKEAASRVMNLALTGYVSGQRIGEIRRLKPHETGPLSLVNEGLAKEILKQGEVTAARANLIARTETTRVSTELTEARAKYIGSEYFTWRTANDADVRPLHRKLNGKKFRWDDPPIADERTGIKALPGCIWNCRCFAVPQIPDIFLKED